MPLPYLYPYDPTGLATTNLIENELHNVTAPVDSKDANFIVPRAAPFFGIGTVLRTGPLITDPELTMGIDYVFTHPFLEATQTLGKLIYGSVMFLDRAYTGNVYISYNTLGGGFTLDDYSIVESLTRSLYNLAVVSWTQITGLPETFPPLPHHENLADLKGTEDIVEKLALILGALQANGGNVNTLAETLGQHINNLASHTKAQVGLGYLNNYRLATQNDLEIQSPTCYMNAQMTVRAIAMYATAGGVSGFSDDNKVDKTTTVTGGGLATGGGALNGNQVITVSKSTIAQAIAASADDKALTPLTGAYLVEKWKGSFHLPADNTQVEIIDVDLMTRPGHYLLLHSTILDSVNDGKVPTFARSNAYTAYGCQLIVYNTFQDAAETGGLVQRLMLTPSTSTICHVWERKMHVDTSGVWADWETISQSRDVLASCDYLAEGTATVTITNAVNVASGNWSNTTSGNYYSHQSALAGGVFVVHFDEPATSLDYTINHTLTTALSVGSIHQLMIVDKQLDKFSFCVIALADYAHGSVIAQRNDFKVSFTVTGARTLTNV